MKAWIFSDTHLPHADIPIEHLFPEIPHADVCICAGDLIESDPEAGVVWLAKNVRPLMRVVYVLGNHEFYSLESSMESERHQARNVAGRLGIDLLDDSTVTIDGVNFMGTTLWSDFVIFAGDSMAKRDQAMAVAASALADFRLIQANGEPSEIWTPHLARMQHLQSRFWLEKVLSEQGGRRVIVSHHAPHPASIAPQFAKDLVTAGFVSDLTELITRHQPSHWVHGHTHTSFRYRVGATKIICNPKGYRHETVIGYDPGLVVEI